MGFLVPLVVVAAVVVSSLSSSLLSQTKGVACNVPWPDIWETSGLQLLLLRKQTDGIDSIVSPVKFGSLFHGSLTEQVFFSTTGGWGKVLGPWP